MITPLIPCSNINQEVLYNPKDHYNTDNKQKSYKYGFELFKTNTFKYCKFRSGEFIIGNGMIFNNQTDEYEFITAQTDSGVIMYSTNWFMNNFKTLFNLISTLNCEIIVKDNLCEGLFEGIPNLQFKSISSRKKHFEEFKLSL